VEFVKHAAIVTTAYQQTGVTHVGQDFLFMQEFVMYNALQWPRLPNQHHNLVWYVTVHVKCAQSKQRIAHHATLGCICSNRVVIQPAQQVMYKRQ
jgi:hypothetical protein